MDLRESDELVAFRAEARNWLEAHAPAKGSPEDFTSGRDRRFVEGCRQWQAAADSQTSPEGRWQFHLLTAPSVRIASGTDEIQRNILGERTLGLPRHPRPSVPERAVG